MLVPELEAATVSGKEGTGGNREFDGGDNEDDENEVDDAEDDEDDEDEVEEAEEGDFNVALPKLAAWYGGDLDGN